MAAAMGLVDVSPGATLRWGCRTDGAQEDLHGLHGQAEGDRRAGGRQDFGELADLGQVRAGRFADQPGDKVKGAVDRPRQAVGRKTRAEYRQTIARGRPPQDQGVVDKVAGTASARPAGRRPLLR